MCHRLAQVEQCLLRLAVSPRELRKEMARAAAAAAEEEEREAREARFNNNGNSNSNSNSSSSGSRGASDVQAHVMDLDGVLKLCRRHGLFSALIYVYNAGLNE